MHPNAHNRHYRVWTSPLTIKHDHPLQTARNGEGPFIDLVAMKMSGELDGVDFEWFVEDAAGNIALFVTAGGGFVPLACAKAVEAIGAVSASIPTPHLGSGLLWGDYGAVGLYVYDWTWPEGPYGLIQYPTAPMPAELRRAILQLPAVPRIDGEFARTKCVEQGALLAT